MGTQTGGGAETLEQVWEPSTGTKLIGASSSSQCAKKGSFLNEYSPDTDNIGFPFLFFFFFYDIVLTGLVLSLHTASTCIVGIEK
jgi:hypothetical protein